MTNESFNNIIDKFTKKRGKINIRSKFLNKYDTPDSWKVIDTWKGFNTDDFMNASGDAIHSVTSSEKTRKHLR